MTTGGPTAQSSVSHPRNVGHSTPPSYHDGRMTYYCGFCQSVVGYGKALPARRKCKCCGLTMNFPKHAMACPAGGCVGDCNCTPDYKTKPGD